MKELHEMNSMELMEVLVAEADMFQTNPQRLNMILDLIEAADEAEEAAEEEAWEEEVNDARDIF